MIKHFILPISKHQFAFQLLSPNVRDATHLSSKSRNLHLPSSLPTFHILLLCWFQVQTYMEPIRETSQNPANKENARIILIG